MSEKPPVSGFDDLIGLTFTEMGPDGVTATLEVTDKLLQPYGIVHGGVLCTIVESVGSVSGSIWYDGPVVGASNTTNFLRAVRSGTLTARSTPIHRGKTSQLWDIDITDQAGKLVAKGQLRLANLTGTDRIGQK